jgi:hypothetical protein
MPEVPAQTAEEYWKAFVNVLTSAINRDSSWKVAWRKGPEAWLDWLRPNVSRVSSREWLHDSQPGNWTTKWRDLAGTKAAELRVLIGYSGNKSSDLEKARALATSLRNPGPNLLIVGPVQGKANEEFRAWHWQNGDFNQMDGAIILPEIPE